MAILEMYPTYETRILAHKTGRILFGTNEKATLFSQVHKSKVTGKYVLNMTILLKSYLFERIIRFLEIHRADLTVLTCNIALQ